MFQFIILMIGALVLLLFSTRVKSEGYYCPYNELGATTDNQLLYDYYSDNDGTFWTRLNQTGWMKIKDYCANKADTLLHSDAGEWKCNDSHLLCVWNGSSCKVNKARLPDCKELCQAVLNNNGPECLGNCPAGQSSNTLYSQFCEPQRVETQHNHTIHDHTTHNHQNNKNKRRRCRKKLQ